MHFLHSSIDQARDCANAALGYLQYQRKGKRPVRNYRAEAQFGAESENRKT